MSITKKVSNFGWKNSMRIETQLCSLFIKMNLLFFHRFQIGKKNYNSILKTLRSGVLTLHIKQVNPLILQLVKIQKIAFFIQLSLWLKKCSTTKNLSIRTCKKDIVLFGYCRENNINIVLECLQDK
ncbi:hypothetical protein PHYBLDRAFT_73599 [Phycomyces blakesleeanus NRRL 1555(-)]|uniref:Uncharacterized protein n=1 Tax=Phycomyces blakesleeanus (strain ATCC 8743b / DSM 1359 / FGSC 10004 / NBRC 33097 / NRRL 1555) TaxID=763407 RepID=A0A167PKB2_PHYB8|nr:hypothetical protein PHYBLDRAFT_73599 [Phycomyces blakesleeanus NRRL 1555(-)]OAD78117.1 hypothetical protein PHYBLDRAFT_73599 [Phycomyces blakesleeanus NRRL 1555(-)]|eukprot:XP_018296157.1 hypothetical protein PHYBLDRAFT_73599 [Phycomyces blakesleeanus NRRL 1555(-)]